MAKLFWALEIAHPSFLGVLGGADYESRVEIQKF